MSEFGRQISYSLTLKVDHVLLQSGKTFEEIAIDKVSKLLITADQGGRSGHNSWSEVYVENTNGLHLVAVFNSVEPVVNLRELGVYKQAEDLAKNLAAHFQISWEYKISVDTPAKARNINIVMTLIMCAIIIIATVTIYRYLHPIK